MLRSDKRGQFYLTIAVIIIVVILASIFLKQTVLKNPVFSEIENNEISGDKILEYGEYSGENDYTILIKELKVKYFDKLNAGEKIYFVFMDGVGTALFEYQEIPKGSINLDSSEKLTQEIIEEVYTPKEIKVNNNLAEFFIGSEKYSFEIKPNKNIYIIIGE